MKDKIIEALLKVNFSERYINICNGFTDFDNGATFKKKDVQEILDCIGTNLDFSSREKLFLKNYLFGNITTRLVLTYKYGFIGCTYAFWTEGFKERVSESFFRIATLIDVEIESKVSYKFPIATSFIELEEILKELIELHNDFILAYSNILCLEEE